MQKNEILVQTALVMGGFWTIQKITPKSVLLSLTILFVTIKHMHMYFNYLKKTAFSEKLLTHCNHWQSQSRLGTVELIS